MAKEFLLSDYIDFRKVMLDSYVYLGLDEKEFVFLLHLHDIQNKNVKTTEEMFDKIVRVSRLSLEECQKITSFLLENGYLDLQFVDDCEKFDFKPLLSKLNLKLEKTDNEKEMLNILEDLFKRNLTTYELNDVASWNKIGISKDELNKAIDEARKVNKLSIKYIDALLNNRIVKPIIKRG